MLNIKGRKFLISTVLNSNCLIFSFILFGVISTFGCVNKDLRILDFMGNSKESGFVEFYSNFENKPEYPSKTKLLVYKYNKRGNKLFTEPVGSGIRIIEKPGIHTYFAKIKGSVQSEKVVVNVVDKMTTPVIIYVNFGPIESTKEVNPIGLRDIEHITQYFKMSVSIGENIPINRYPQASESVEESLKKDVYPRKACEIDCKRMFERGELKKGMSIEKCIRILCK